MARVALAASWACWEQYSKSESCPGLLVHITYLLGPDVRSTLAQYEWYKENWCSLMLLGVTRRVWFKLWLLKAEPALPALRTCIRGWSII